VFVGRDEDGVRRSGRSLRPSFRLAPVCVRRFEGASGADKRFRSRERSGASAARERAVVAD